MGTWCTSCALVLPSKGHNMQGKIIMVQYADDSIRITEKEFIKAFRKLHQQMQDDCATAFTIISMDLFYPENMGKEPNPRDEMDVTNPDKYQEGR